MMSARDDWKVVTIEMMAAAAVSLAESRIPNDVAELLFFGDPERNIEPRALEKAIAEAVRRQKL